MCEQIEAPIACRSCNARDYAALDMLDRLRCPQCGSYRVDALDPAELLLALERLRAERLQRRGRP